MEIRQSMEGPIVDAATQEQRHEGKFYTSIKQNSARLPPWNGQLRSSMTLLDCDLSCQTPAPMFSLA